MTDLDDRLRSRLLRLEERLPAQSSSTDDLLPRTRRGSRLIGVAVGFLAVALVAGAGTAAVLDSVRGYPDVFSAGGALACTGVVEMAPTDADRLLRELGYTVNWQLSDRDTGGFSSSNVAPLTGFISAGILKGHELIIVVESGAGVEPQQRSC